jgi:hypothetical protein
MLPQSQARKKKNSSKVNLAISFVFHTLLVLVALYFAAHSGILGKQAQKFTVSLEKKEPEKPKEEKPKQEPQKVEQPKVEQPKMEEPKMEEAKTAPPDNSAPSVAPAATDLPSFDFDGGRQVISESDPVQVYKSRVEYEFKSKWDRPEDMDDAAYVAEVQVTVDKDGSISNPVWEKGSGNKRWDDSVRKVIDEVTSMGHKPPTNFPSQVTIRFDVQEEAALLMQ